MDIFCPCFKIIAVQNYNFETPFSHSYSIIIVQYREKDYCFQLHNFSFSEQNEVILDFIYFNFDRYEIRFNSL